MINRREFFRLTGLCGLCLPLVRDAEPSPKSDFGPSVTVTDVTPDLLKQMAKSELDDMVRYLNALYS